MMKRRGTGAMALCLTFVTTLWGVASTVSGQDQQQNSRIDYQAELPPIEARLEPSKTPFEPPREETISDDQFCAMVRLGHQIFVDTQNYAYEYVGNRRADWGSAARARLSYRRGTS